MNRQSMLKNLVLEVGGLLLFWGLSALGWGRYATMAALAFVVVDAVRRWRNKLGFPRVWCLFNGLVLALALPDFVLTQQTLERYEPILTNLAIALMFAIGALGKKPLIQEIAEQRQGAEFPDNRQDLLRFFRVYTWVWAAYFLLRVAFHIALAETVSDGRMHSIEDIVGPLSLVGMIALSFFGARIFRLAVRMGIITTTLETQKS
nr:hypothetical protein [uncultured Acetobacter sp.]